MVKKKLASTVPTDSSVLRRSGRETSTRKQTTSSPVISKKSERVEKHTSPSSSPVKNKLERTETQMGPSPLRRSDRGKKSVEIPELTNIKSTKEKTASNSKQNSEDVDEVKESEKQNPDDGGRKRKRFTARQYKAIFCKPQRIRIQPDVDENPKVKDKSPQANISRNEDVDKELKTQNSVGVQEGPDKDCETVVEERVNDLDQIEDGDCPQTKSIDGNFVESGDVDKQIDGNVSISDMDIENIDNQIEDGDCHQTTSIDGKSIESGDVEKKTGDYVSPSYGNITSRDNHAIHTSSSNRVEPDLENQQEPDTCHKVAETQKEAGNMENNDVSSNMQNSNFVEFWVPVQISNVQLEQYCSTLLSNAMALCSSSKTDKFGALNSMFIANRKCCNHPYTMNKTLQGSIMKYKEQSTVLDVDIKASGKLQFLDHILPEIKKQKLKVLIVYQHTSGNSEKCLELGQILVEYFYQRYGQKSFEHLDGIGKVSSKKQAAINEFNKEPDRFIILLESRSCHHSIKLSVDIIIIFDSELNPSNDLKSLQKLSIDSQSQQVMVFRLFTSSTLEERILKLAENNIAIDMRSHSSRCNYDALLTWGASDLFDKLTKFHSQTVFDFSSEESLLKGVVEEFLYIIYHKGKNMDTTLKSRIIRAQNYGIYGKNNCEVKTHLTDGIQPYMFWRNLLNGRYPIWKFVSESTPRQRKRPSFFTESPPKGAKTRRKTVNICSTVEAGKLNTVTEGVNEGVPAANDGSQSSSGDQYWSTAVDYVTSLLDQLKPTVSELCNIFKFSENVKVIVETFLEYVIDNFQVSKEHRSALQAFMISLCWIGSSLGKSQIDRSESFALAKKHFNFSCTEEEANVVCEKLIAVKESFLNDPEILDRLKDILPAQEVVKPEVIKSQYSHSASAFENHDSSENVSKKGEEEFEEINRIWDKKRESLKQDYILEKQLIHAIYSKNPALRAENLIMLERKFANKLEEHERLKPIVLLDEGQMAADVAPTLPENPIEVQSHDEPVCEGANDVESTGSHTSEKEVVDATVCNERIEEVPAQQVDDDDDMEVDVEEKVDSSHEDGKGGAGSPDVSHAVEETGGNDVAPDVDSGDVEAPAGDHSKESDEDRTVGLDTSLAVEDFHENVDDVALEVECVEMGMPAVDDVATEVECVEMGSPAGTHAVEDLVEGHNETDVNDKEPLVDSGDMEMQAGSYNQENNEDGSVGLDTSPVFEDRHEVVDDVAPEEVECAEMGMPAGNYNKENNEDDTVGLDTSSHVVKGPHEVDDVAPEVDCAEMDFEEGEIRPDVGENLKEPSPNDVSPHADSAEMEMPVGTCDKEDTEDGEIIPDFVDDHNKTSPSDVIPHAESAEMEAPAGTCDKEETEDGEIASDFGDDRNETSPNDVTPHAEMEAPAGTCDNAEDGSGTPNVDDDHDETSLKDVLPRVELADMEMPAGNEENDEDNIIMPDAVHANEAHNDSGGSDGNDPVCAALLQEKTSSVQQVSSPASDHLEPIIPEIQNEPLQLEQLPDSGIQDEDSNIGDLQPSDSSQLDQMMLDVEPSSPDPMVADNPSTGENLDNNLAAAVETSHEVHQPSVAPTPPVNPYNVFDNIANRVSPQLPIQTDPLQAEVERLNMVKASVTKYHEETKQKLNIDCEKEISDIIMKIRLKYEAKHVEADLAFNKKKMELETNIGKVNMNKILAQALRSKCQDITSSGNTGMQQVSQAALLQQMYRVPSSFGQSSRNQQPPQPPPSLPQPQPLQPPQTRPQPPLQVVHQPAALFSTRPAPVVTQATTSTPPTTTRPPPVINHIPPSTTTSPRPTSDPTTPSSAPPTTTRPPPIITHTTSSTTTRPLPTSTPITPSNTSTTNRLPHGYNTINPTAVSNRSPPSITQIDMSAANLRISTETRAQSSHTRPVVRTEPRAPAPHFRPLVGSEPRSSAPHFRPLVGSEPRASAPHFRPLVGNEPRAAAPHIRHLVSSESRAPAPHMRSSVSSEPRAPAPHLRSATPRPFRSTPQLVTSGPSQPTIIPPLLTPLPSEPVILQPQPPPLSEPSPSSGQTPLLAHDLVCLSDDD